MHHNQRLLLIAISFMTFLLSACTPTVHETHYPPNGFAEGISGGVLTGKMVETASSTLTSGWAFGLGTGFGLAYGMYTSSNEGIAATLREHNNQVVILGDTTTVYLPTDKVFRVNTPTIRSEAYGDLGLVAKMARAFPKNTPIIVTVNSDNVHDTSHDLALTRKQAQSVVAMLWSLGVPHSRLQQQGYGPLNPIDINRIPSGAANNRRIEITFHQSRPTTWGGFIVPTTPA